MNRIYIARGEGHSWGFSLGVCRPDLQILTLFQTNLKCHFPHPFSDLEEITNRNMFTKTEIISSLLRLERGQKDFLKFILNSHTSCGVISYSFGTIRQICSYATVAPSKTIPVFRPKRCKTLPFGAAHTYMGYLREYPPPGLYRNKWYFGKGSKALAANPSRNQVSPRKLQC